MNWIESDFFFKQIFIKRDKKTFFELVPGGSNTMIYIIIKLKVVPCVKTGRGKKYLIIPNAFICFYLKIYLT